MSLTSLYQLFVEVRQIKRHQKGEKLVLRFKTWIYALKMAKIRDFREQFDILGQKNTIFELKNAVYVLTVTVHVSINPKSR